MLPMRDGTSKDRATQLLICEPLSFAICWMISQLWGVRSCPTSFGCEEKILYKQHIVHWRKYSRFLYKYKYILCVQIKLHLAQKYILLVGYKIQMNSMFPTLQRVSKYVSLKYLVTNLKKWQTIKKLRGLIVINYVLEEISARLYDVVSCSAVKTQRTQ